MSKLRSAWQGILQTLKRKPKELPKKLTPEEEEKIIQGLNEGKDPKEIKASINPLNEGSKPPRYGIKRTIVYGIAGTVIVALISSFYFSTMDFGKKRQIERVDEEGAYAPATIKNNHDNLPSDYESVNRARLASKYGDQAPQVGGHSSAADTDGVSEQAIGQPIPQTQPVAPAPMIPQRDFPAPQQYPRYAPSVPNYAALSQAQQTPGTATRKKQEYDSAIRFSWGAAANEAQAVENTQNDAHLKPQGTQTSPSAQLQGYTQSTPNTLQVGTVIPAILITGINSDVEGQAIAQVREDVYDSATGQVLLIPQGSRLVGRYSGKVSTGQSRINVEWSTLIYPSGTTYDLGSMLAIDGAGYAGLRDQVKNHTGKVLGAAAMTSALAALGSIAAGNTGDSDNYNAGQLAVQGAAGNLLNTASSLVQREMNVQPTIIIRPGFNFSVLVNQTLQF